MATISKDNPVFTVVVRFKCEPGDQQKLLDVMEAVEPVFARQPGFISMSVHRNLDGTDVLNYLQWRSRADHESCLFSPQVMEAGKDLMEYIASGKAQFEVLMYDVVRTHDAP